MPIKKQRKKPAITVRRTRGHRRSSSEGNSLWQVYSGLGVDQRDAFLALLAQHKIPYTTFNLHSRKGRRLDAIPGKNLILYRDFFYLETETRFDLYKEAKKEAKELAEGKPGNGSLAAGRGSSGQDQPTLLNAPAAGQEGGGQP